MARMPIVDLTVRPRVQVQYEYMSFHLNASDDTDAVLSEYGLGGWRVIYMDREGGFTYITMERVKDG